MSWVMRRSQNVAGPAPKYVHTGRLPAARTASTSSLAPSSSHVPQSASGSASSGSGAPLGPERMVAAAPRWDWPMWPGRAGGYPRRRIGALDRVGEAGRVLVQCLDESRCFHGRTVGTPLGWRFNR